MNTLQVINEIRAALQAQVYTDESVDGTNYRTTKLLITDETQRKTLTDKLVTLLATVEPE